MVPAPGYMALVTVVTVVLVPPGSYKDPVPGTTPGATQKGGATGKTRFDHLGPGGLEQPNPYLHPIWRKVAAEAGHLPTIRGHCAPRDVRRRSRPWRAVLANPSASCETLSRPAMTVPETDRPSNREAPAPPFAVGRAGQPRKAPPTTLVPTTFGTSATTTCSRAS